MSDEKPSEVEPGALYLVPTPIGNLGDLSPRARAVLADVDIIAAEDTRSTRKLFLALGMKVRARLVSYHDHNAEARADALVLDLTRRALSVALVSDAGTPCLSDPGYRLVQKASEADVRVVPLPGPAAFLCALIASGLPTDQALFAGFLPAASSKRRARLAVLAGSRATICLYASPRRVVDVLRDALNVMGPRRACVAREITKRYEEIIRGTLPNLIDDLNGRDALRGEFCVIIEGDTAPIPEGDESEALRLIGTLRGHGLAPSAIKKIVATHCGIATRDVYALMTRSKER